ncbi:ABC transporter permease [Dorea sp. D27]|uniref:ABC transporter permease n=1 Tax=Dorea sp. D27 TaxID=658665 RepID=UPI0006736848|nr:ABC transporter permease [Dorea sp. D27]KMZ53137.1 putative antimicrobial peptide ABC transporter permease [Dorea sp. D27]
MFFDMIRRNSKRNRKENSIFFGSLVVAVVLFYMILSLEGQNVIQFLYTMESDAVNRLLGLVPVLYVFSLFLIFFLVYFAGKYQLECRNREFGIYLMLGMKRRRLFGILMAEDMWNSMLALLAGLPLSIFLSEMVSLITSRLVGLGILGHQPSFSLGAVLWTAVGFFGVKILAFLMLSRKIAGQEISSLMEEGQEEKQSVKTGRYAALRLLAGLLLLLAAYGMAIAGLAWKNIFMMAPTVTAGTVGTFLLFSGLGKGLESFLNKSRRKGLSTFTYRQLQENVFLKHRSMAVSSLLILLALVCFAYGIAVGWVTKGDEGHAVDFTFTGEERHIRSELATPELKDMLTGLSGVKVSLLYTEEETQGSERKEHVFETAQLSEAVGRLKDTEEKQKLNNNLQYFTSPYIISLSGYNDIRKMAGKDAIHLKDNETALYSDADFSDDRYKETVEEVCRMGTYLAIDGEQYRVSGTLYTDNFVADRLMTIDLGLIVTDTVFDRLFDEEQTSTYWNASVQKELVEEKGLLQAVMQVNSLLKNTDLEYETYLQGLGRQMFYNVASAYVSLYLAAIFLVIANTVISVQYLMQQKKSRRRYRMLMMLGSGSKEVCRSSDTQIRWYFALTVVTAAISSIFGISSLFGGILPSGLESRTGQMFWTALLMAGLLGIVEYVYITVVMRAGRRHILEMMRPPNERTD